MSDSYRFWSELSEDDRFQVEYQGKRWTGYMSLVACLRRALSEGTPITTPRFWRQQHCSDETIRHVFRSATDEPMPLLDERIAILREAGAALKASVLQAPPLSALTDTGIRRCFRRRAR